MPTSTRIERRRQPEGARLLGFAERLSLFIGTLHKAEAEALFAGLATPLQQRASTFAEGMKSWDSARRQARLSHEFGVRPDAAERIEHLVVQADGVLRAAIVASLPPLVRKQFPQFQGGVESFPVAVRALAARLVREASR